ncbi:MAG: VPLPA-CTERM sorting domain-containing protein [Rhodobacteraceae bacterium]|nr:VPLPA-CTERM sorting domain-containing protein [Paracoccaceae bacterium]
MTFHRFIGAALAALLAASAGAVTLDFGGGTGITETDAGPIYVQDGVTFGLSSSGGAGPALFNSNCLDACNGDADLQPAVQDENGVAGNVLIQQNPNEDRPNDDPNTLFLTITLLSDVQLIWTGVSLVDDGLYKASTNLDAMLGEVTLNGESETAELDFASSVLGMGDSVTVSFFLPNGNAGASGAIDNLIFAPVPLPASSQLLLGALGGMAAMRHRKA